MLNLKAFFRRKQRNKKENALNNDANTLPLEEIINELPLNEEKKKEWLQILEKTPEDFKQILQDLIEHFKLPYADVSELINRAKNDNTQPLLYLTEIEKMISWEELVQFWSEKYGIKYDKLFSAYKVINPLNNPKRIGEFLFGDGLYSKNELAIYNPLDFKRAIEVLGKAFIEDDKRYISLKRGDLEIVLVNPKLFENKELLRKVEDQKTKAEDLKRKFKEIIKTAIQLNVSDIHFSPKKSFVEVKARLYGDLHPFMHLTHNEWKAMLRVIKTMARESGSVIDVAEWRMAQDAKIAISEFDIDLRLAFSPSPEDGEQYLVIRLLYKGQAIKYEKGKEVELIKSLGYFEDDAKFLAEYVMTKEKGQGGILIMAGATGSGKSKTLNTILALIPPIRSIKTIEEPIEYRLKNADQHEVMEFIKGDEKIEFGFLQAIKEFMRQDPDVIFVGEWRKDPELTSSITYATKTGHFVLTTLHSSRVVNIPDLLLEDYKVDKPTQANTLSLLISQRLLKTVCPNCGLVEKIDYTKIEEDLNKIPFLDSKKLFEILDAFENDKIRIKFKNVDLKEKQLIPLGSFIKLIEEVLEDKDLEKIVVEIPDIFERPIENLKQTREEGRIHQIIGINNYKKLLKQAIGKVLDEFLEAFETAKKNKENLDERQKLTLNRFKTAFEDYIEGEKIITKVNTEKFVKFFLYPALRETDSITKLRQLTRFYSPQINPNGCEKCIRTNPMTGQKISAGIKGRTPIYEYLFVDNELKELIFNTTEALEIEKMLLKKKDDFIVNKDRSISSKAKSFIDTFVDKLKEGYIWSIPYSEIVKLKQ